MALWITHSKIGLTAIPNTGTVHLLTIAPVGSCEIGPPKSFDLLSSVQLYKTVILDFQLWSTPYIYILYNLINVISCDMTWHILIWFDINWNMFYDDDRKQNGFDS
jgi:hypothetical protein